MLRYLLCMCLVLAGCASTKQSAYINQPVRVTGEGKTFNEAKNNAFSVAMEYAVGAVVVTDNTVQNKKLVKEEIIKHSAGYVDDFTIISRVETSNQVTLIMDVKVKHSAIAERIINVQVGNGPVQGERLDGLHSSFMETRKTGDQLLDVVLQDYPKRALNVETSPVQYMLNINRLPVIVIPYKITWNYKYIQALNEALDQTQNPKDRYIKQEQINIISKSPSSWLLGSTDKHYYNDVIRSDMIKKGLGKMVYVQTALKDGNGKVLKLGCDYGRVMTKTAPNGTFVLDGNIVIEEEVERTIKVNSGVMANIVSVEVTVESKPCTFIN